MKTFLTQLRAIDPADGELKSWAGPNVQAAGWDAAERYCRENIGYLSIIGEALPAPCALLACPLCGHEWEGPLPEPAQEREQCPVCGNMVEPEIKEI